MGEDDIQSSKDDKTRLLTSDDNTRISDDDDDDHDHVEDEEGCNELDPSQRKSLRLQVLDMVFPEELSKNLAIDDDNHVEDEEECTELDPSQRKSLRLQVLDMVLPEEPSKNLAIDNDQLKVLDIDDNTTDEEEANHVIIEDDESRQQRLERNLASNQGTNSATRVRRLPPPGAFHSNHALNLNAHDDNDNMVDEESASLATVDAIFIRSD